MSGRVLGPVLAVPMAAMALAGCSLGDEDEPEAASGVPAEVAGTLDRLERASQSGDWEVVCEEVFSSTARKLAGGRDCPRLLREQARDVRRPEIRVESIEISGDRARARVRTRAAGQAVLEETIVLVREDDGWRIESLAAG